VGKDVGKCFTTKGLYGVQTDPWQWPGDRYVIFNKLTQNFTWSIIDAGTHFVIVEADEFSHNSYDKSCQNIRQENIVQALGLPSVFISLQSRCTSWPHNKDVDLCLLYQETAKLYWASHPSSYHSSCWFDRPNPLQTDILVFALFFVMVHTTNLLTDFLTD
jgi:hypothetical protein